MCKNIYIILLGFIFVILYCCSFTTNNKGNHPLFSYSLLSKDTLKYKLTSPDKFKLFSKKEIQLTNINATIGEYHYMIDSIFDIKYIKYNFSGIDSISIYKDKLQILGHEITIDSLFYGEDFSKDKISRVSALNRIYNFNFSGREYICFYIQDVTNPSSMLNTDILLFDITNKNNLMLILHDYQASENLKCFGDFNKNKKLDYAFWSFGDSFQDTLNMFELNDNKFELIKNKYILIDENEKGYYINSDKSKWFP